MQGRELMKEWVKEVLRDLGGSASILEICKGVWKLLQKEIRQTEDLFYQWQYEIRWAGDLLRREGVILSAASSPRGVWQLS